MIDFRIGCCILLSISAVVFSCDRSTSASDGSEQARGANARVATPTIGPGEVVGDLYVNAFLNLELPVMQGWETGDQEMVNEVFDTWNPAAGLDSLPSVFLFTTGRTIPDNVQAIQTGYFLQIEPTGLYPEFAGDPKAYLSEVGKILVNQAGQELLGEVRIDTLGRREVQRMDVAFRFGELPGRQTYFTWTDNGLFVNLVFTYADDEDWQLLSSSVLDLMHLE